MQNDIFIFISRHLRSIEYYGIFECIVQISFFVEKSERSRKPVSGCASMLVVSLGIFEERISRAAVLFRTAANKQLS